jgi:excisionase family DNA binding protein
MNKQEAADFLGVSTRAIERYTAKGKLTPEYENIKGGQRIAVYDEKQLAQVKAEMQAPPPARPVLWSDSGPDKADRGDRGAKSQALARRGTDVSDFLKLIAQAVKEGQGSNAAPVPTLSLSDKLTLSVSEASHLSGLSRNHLLEAIHAGKLKAKIIGRGWRVKRDDLDAYVKKL